MIRQLDRANPVLRLHPRSDDPDELALTAAAGGARIRSDKRLADAFGGATFTTIAQRCDTNRAALLSVNTHLLEELDWRIDVDRAYRHADPGTSDVDVAHGGVKNPEDTTGRAYRRHPDEAGASVRTFGLVNALRDGATAIANNIGRAAGLRLVELETDLARVVGTSVQTNVYFSEREATGFGPHWDDHDVIILQCTGRKLWEVYFPASLSPVRSAVDRGAAGEPVWSGVLSPGQALYIPRGWTHSVAGFEDEFSVHYTIGFTRLSAADALQSAIDLAARDIQRHPPTFQRFIAPVSLVAAGVELACARRRAAIEVRRGNGPLIVAEAFSTGLDDTPLVTPFPGGTIFVDDDVAHDEVGLAAHRSCFAVARRLVPSMCRLMSAEPFTIAGLATGPGSPPIDDIRAAVQSLASIDLVRMTDSSQRTA